jgi:2-phospho-L-lactate guanylyltransferase
MIGDYAIVPVREFASAKMRLKNDLSREERSALASALLKRVVQATESSHVEHAVIVASNASEANSCLEGISRISVIPEKDHHGGVNGAMRTGIDFAINKGAKRIALYPADLPLITHSKIDEALDLLAKYDLVMNPSLKKDGTNFLAMNSTLSFELHYDDDSFIKHSSEARSRQLNFLVLDWKEFSVDLDDAGDLDRAMTIYKSKGFSDFLKNIPMR